jgi:hypothetical protein
MHIKLNTKSECLDILNCMFQGLLVYVLILMLLALAVYY